jgi:hypothetical protein
MTEEDIKKLIGFNVNSPCCASCHEDADYGYGICDIEYKGKYVDVCCVVADAFYTWELDNDKV